MDIKIIVCIPKKKNLLTVNLYSQYNNKPPMSALLSCSSNSVILQ